MANLLDMMIMMMKMHTQRVVKKELKGKKTWKEKREKTI